MKNSDKKYFLPILLILVFSLISISVGFSSLSTTLSIDGSAAFIPVDMIRFTRLETNQLNNAYEEDKRFLIQDLNFTIELDQLSSSATYNVTLSNLGQVDKILTSITNEIFTNDDITYELNGIGVNTIIRKGEDVNFTITFKYKNGITIDDTKLNARLKFNFDDYINTQGTYIVTFDANGGSGTMNDMQFVIDEYKKLNANTFYYDGYYFKEWNTMPDGTGISYHNKQNVKNINNGESSVVLYAIWDDELEEVSYEGTCQFNGQGNPMEGECSADGDDFLNTHIAPFSEENYQKSFILSFTITDVDPSAFTSNKRDTIFNVLYEANDRIKGIYPGALLRIEGNRWQLQAGNGKSSATKVYFSQNELIDKKFTLIRHNNGNTNKIYYMIDDNDPIFLRDVTELYAPFDTPLTFGAIVNIDNTTPDRYAIATLEDLEFRFLEDGLTLHEIITGEKEEEQEEELETVFSYEGPCIFNGADEFIEGDMCDDYHDAHFINTGIGLFNQDNYEKDFEITFELDDYVTSEQGDDQVTVFNAFLERTGLGYGTVLRRNRNKFELIVRDGNGVSKIVNIDVSNPMLFRLIKKGGNVCYSINGGNLIYVTNISNFADPFNVPLTFGGSIDKNGNPFRYINGTISNMSIKTGTIVESCGS